jgi:hypothetical protein
MRHDGKSNCNRAKPSPEIKGAYYALCTKKEREEREYEEEGKEEKEYPPTRSPTVPTLGNDDDGIHNLQGDGAQGSMQADGECHCVDAECSQCA